MTNDTIVYYYYTFFDNRRSLLTSAQLPVAGLELARPPSPSLSATDGLRSLRSLLLLCPVACYYKINNIAQFVDSITRRSSTHRAVHSAVLQYITFISPSLCCCVTVSDSLFCTHKLIDYSLRYCVRNNT